MRLSNWLGEISCRYAAAAGLGGLARGPGHDAVHADAVGLGRSTDRGILTRARQEARTVVTADLDYPRLLALTGAEGPSLILFRGGDWSEPDVTGIFGGFLFAAPALRA